MGRKTSARHAGNEQNARDPRPKTAGVADSISVVYRPTEELKLNPANTRAHSKKQIRQIAQSIKAFGFNVPVLIDAELNVIAGHGRLLACRELGENEVPTISRGHLSEAQASAFAIADNRLTEIARWDDRLLSEQLRALCLVELDFDLETTGFEIGEIDLRIGALQAETGNVDEPAETLPTPAAGQRVSKAGDLWLLGEHRVLCGSALDPEVYQALMGTERATMIFADPTCVDTIVRRWQALTGKKARHAETGQCFGEHVEPSEATNAS
jgi:hypothetical protein